MPAPNDYFYYTRRERYAVLLLVALLVLSLLYRFALPHISTAPETAPFIHWEADVMAFEAQLYEKQAAQERRRSSYKRTSYSKKQQPPPPLSPAPFDPNTASETELAALGLPPRTIKSILNYRNKGGQFRKAEDLAKIYTLAPEHFEQLYPYLQLPAATATAPTEKVPARSFPFDPNTCTEEEWLALGVSPRTTRSILNYRAKGGFFDTPDALQKIYTLPDSTFQRLRPYVTIREVPRFAGQRSAPPEYTSIDINAATQADFEQFRGIGPSYARRLLHYREVLGGFRSVDQVGELYQLPDSVFQHMRPYLSCATIPLLTININTASIDELKAHPYLSWRQARAIVRYRTEKGPWKSVELVQILPELDDGQGTYERIRPYLSIN